MLGKRLFKANQIARKALKKEYNRFGDFAFESVNQEYFHSPVTLGILRKTRVRCSCWMCRNRRKSEGYSMQELRQM